MKKMLYSIKTINEHINAEVVINNDKEELFLIFNLTTLTMNKNFKFSIIKLDKTFYNLTLKQKVNNEYQFIISTPFYNMANFTKFKDKAFSQGLEKIIFFDLMKYLLDKHVDIDKEKHAELLKEIKPILYTFIERYKNLDSFNKEVLDEFISINGFEYIFYYHKNRKAILLNLEDNGNGIEYDMHHSCDNNMSNISIVINYIKEFQCNDDRSELLKLVNVYNN